MIVITTPTGHIGSLVLQQLLNSDEKLRVICRDASKLTGEVKEKVEVFEGSLDDPEVLAKAYAGAGQLFYIVPPGMQYTDVDAYYLQFATPTCDAIKQQGVKRVVFVSGTGITAENNAGPVSASVLVEKALEATGAATRVLHCGTFMENLMHVIQQMKFTGQFGTPVPAGVKLPWVATRDIADAAVSLLKDKSWTGTGSEGILGPEDISYADISQIISETIGKEIVYQEIAVDAMKAAVMQYGATDAAAQGLVDIYLSMKDGVFNLVERTAASLSPTTFRSWCEAVFKPAFIS